MESNEAIDDAELRRALERAPIPPTPNVEPTVRRLIRRRRLIQRCGVGTAAALLLVVGLIVWQWPRDEQLLLVRNGIVPPVEKPNDSPMHAALFSAPPVDRLSTLSRQQDAYVAALQRMVEE